MVEQLICNNSLIYRTYLTDYETPKRKHYQCFLAFWVIFFSALDFQQKIKNQEVLKSMENNELLIMECDGATYGARFNAEGEVEIYRLTPSGEWEKVED